MQILDPSRNANHPALVAKVAPELARHRWHRERTERCAAVGIEAFDRLEQSERRDLFEVVDGLAAIHEAPGQGSRERHVVLDDAIAQRAVVRAPVFAELFEQLRRLCGILVIAGFVAHVRLRLTSRKCRAPSWSEISCSSTTAPMIVWLSSLTATGGPTVAHVPSISTTPGDAT